MADFKGINEARQLLGLGEDATLVEIKDAYRSRAKQYHPDTCTDNDKAACEKMFKKITHAYDILMSYCAGYRYSFKEAEVKKGEMDKEYYDHLRRFYDGWWGNLDL